MWGLKLPSAIVKYRTATISILVVAAIASFFQHWIANRIWRVFLQPARTYEQVSIGDSKAEVEYKLGVPKYVLAKPEYNKEWKGYSQRVFDVNGNPSTDKAALASNDSFENYNYWEFPKSQSNDDPVITVQFDKFGKVDAIECMSLSQMIDGCDQLFHVGIGDQEAGVTGKLGKPAYMKYDGVTKSIFYQKLHFALTLEKQRVYIIKTIATDDLALAN